MRASHGRLARPGLATLLVAIAGFVAVTSQAFAERPAPDQANATTAMLRRAVERDPGVVRERWFLRKASLVNFVLPVTIRLLPARDGVGHFVSNDQVGNYATLALGQSLGARAIGLGGYVDADIMFRDSFSSGQPGDVDVRILADDATVTSTSIPLLTNPDVSTQAAGQNHVDQLDLAGASGGAFDLRWVGPDGAAHVVAGLQPASLNATSLTAALQAALGGNNVFATQTGTGMFLITLSGKYTAPASGLQSFQVTGNTTGAPVSIVNADAGHASAGGCAGFTGDGTPNDVDTLDKLQPSLDPGTNNIGPNWQWDPLGHTNEKDVVLRTNSLQLTIDTPGSEATVPAGVLAYGTSGNGAAGRLVGASGGRANIFGLPVDGLGEGNSVDVTVNLLTKVSSIVREVDAATPGPAGQPDETLGTIGAYFDCRQAWTGWVENHLGGIHLVGALHIAPAITADGRLRIAKVFLSSPDESRQAVTTCLVPYALFASGNAGIGDSAFTTSSQWSANPIGPNLIDGLSTSAAFNPLTTLNPDSSAAAPDVPCDSPDGPLNRNPFNVAAGGAAGLDQMLKTGAAVAVAGDLTVQRLVGEVIIGHFPDPPVVAISKPADAQIVAGIRITPGKAKAKGKTGCVSRPFNVTVRGTSIASIVFKVDGRTVDKFPNVIDNIASVRVNPKGFSLGVHRVTATVRFKPGTGAKTKTLNVSFARCDQALVPPRFTG